MQNLSPTSLTVDSCSRCFDLAHINVTALRYSIICPESVELIKANKAHRMDSGQRKLHVCGESKRGWFFAIYNNISFHASYFTICDIQCRSQCERHLLSSFSFVSRPLLLFKICKSCEAACRINVSYPQ